MRQVGLTVILAQAGCLVPASFARVGIVDRIFTRVGAVDSLGDGQSTFQVEMAETSAILSQATDRSLVLLDEIGRGTAVGDGMAIAWAVAVHMSTAKFGGDGGDIDVGGATVPCAIPRTIFITHYHELNELASLLPSVTAFRMEAIPAGLDLDGSSGDGDWVYTHRILPGASWDSHGLTIAKRAGFPDSVIECAADVLDVLRVPLSELSSHLREALHADLKMATVGNSAKAVRVTASDGASIPCTPTYDAGFEAGRRAGLVEAQEILKARISAPLA